jgi:putative endonuclease
VRNVGHTACQLCGVRALSPQDSWHTATPLFNTFLRSVRGVSIEAQNEVGRRGEQLAAEHLERLGFALVERNYRTRWGELDIVAFDGRVLAFVEVKSRRSAAGVVPLESIRGRKRAQIRKMAGAWLIARRDRPYAQTLRFDAIGVTVDAAGRLVSLEHLEGAF